MSYIQQALAAQNEGEFHVSSGHFAAPRHYYEFVDYSGRSPVICCRFYPKVAKIFGLQESTASAEARKLQAEYCPPYVYCYVRTGDKDAFLLAPYSYSSLWSRTVMSTVLTMHETYIVVLQNSHSWKKSRRPNFEWHTTAPWRGFNDD